MAGGGSTQAAAFSLKWYGHGWVLTRMLTFASGVLPYDSFPGDADGDGKPELYVSSDISSGSVTRARTRSPRATIPTSRPSRTTGRRDSPRSCMSVATRSSNSAMAGVPAGAASARASARGSPLRGPSFPHGVGFVSIYSKRDRIVDWRASRINPIVVLSR